MNLMKISLTAISYSVISQYNDGNGRDLWEDIYVKLGSRMKSDAIFRSGKGKMQQLIYVAADEDAEAFKQMTKEIISELVSDDDLSKIIVAVSVPDTDELEAIKKEIEDKNAGKLLQDALNDGMKKNVDEEREKSRLGVFPIFGTHAKKNSEEAPKEKTEAVQRKDASEKDEHTSLPEITERMIKLKKDLCASIKGQNHAIDVVVRGLFECEMFTKVNPDAKGPLATFLFAGPSGVGKSMLAKKCAKLLGKECQVVDMAEYSDNLANAKFNGEHGQPAIVTGFARKHPDGIIIFDEIEKAHINTIHMFLELLDEGTMMDMKVNKKVSFRQNIIIMTTNAGKSLYEDESVFDLSTTPRNVIIEGLREDKDERDGNPFFPECIITRMAKGHVILFNHLEPYALMEIIKHELELQIGLFEKSSGVKIRYNPDMLAAIILYNGGGTADARTLTGLAKNTVVSEVQELVTQIFSTSGKNLKTINIESEYEASGEVSRLFERTEPLNAAMFGSLPGKEYLSEELLHKVKLNVMEDSELFKKHIRGICDCIIIDPLCGIAADERMPNDIEDVDSEGMRMFEYAREFYPEIPVYIIDANGSFSHEKLATKGARGSIIFKDVAEFEESLSNIAFHSLVNNSAFDLSRSGKYLSYNCAQYTEENESATIAFEKLRLRPAPAASDKKMMAKQGQTNIRFKDVIGCKTAKEILGEYCEAIANPRKVALSGKRMPKGVLLYGPPGTGKTMLAKAMANECKATFFPVSATSFFGSLVGQSEGNIRALFAKARKYAPSIIFIDEVDAIGRRRTGGISSAHNEDALTTFLAEMDGFVVDEKRPVFILAATNYEISGDGPRVLDGAFVRRFDNKILIPLPDTDERYALLMSLLGKHGIVFGEDHEKIIRLMAERTGGMSNADLDMMTMQYIRALGSDEPDGTKYLDALDNFRFGDVRKMDEGHISQTACHEAGHALVCRLCGITPSFLTIVSRGEYGGYMESASESKRGTQTYSELKDIICRCLAGRVAEIEVYGSELGTNTGASSDIEKARYIARACINDFAMGENLYIHSIKDEAETLLREQYDRARAMICEHKDALNELTELLVESKSLARTQLDEFFKSKNI